MSPTHLDDKKKEQKRFGGFEQWLDDLRCKLTVDAWRRGQKKSARRNQMAAILETVPYAGVIGDVLYMVGFWVEYFFVCAFRKVKRVARGVGSTVLNLLLLILRPFALGIITLCEDVAEPFVRFFQGLRHIRDLAETNPEIAPEDLRSEKIHYFFRGVRRYLPLVWRAVSYLLPVAAAVGLFTLVHTVLGYQYVLEVQLNGESIGYVASEQIFDNARDDVQQRVANARQMLTEAGTEVPDTQWDIQPTYTLAVADETMTESQMANAILTASGDEIVNGTAVYIDGSLRFVTDQGDHLRTYLESVKDPFENGLDSSLRVNFAHEIILEDGVYLKESIASYDSIIETLNEGAVDYTYTAVAGETVASAIENTGLSFDELARLNPEFVAMEQTIPEGTGIVVGGTASELLKVMVVQRVTTQEEIAFGTVTTESSEYDFGKTVVVQEGETGLQEVTRDYTYIDGNYAGETIVGVNVIKSPVSRQIVKGTKLKSGMVAQVGSGSFVWPVPQYTYVSRWMSGYHRGADICAPYGVSVIASDAGAVITAGWHWSYGNYVIIDHGNGWKTLYGHMSSLSVTQGQAVSQGQEIGKVGSTGNSTGNHLHFEMIQNGALYSARNLFASMG